ncbi:uncharacterized protein PV09_04379 [Verruconis gallopava]|uniref:Integral membrane protein n=1 Tax=Verruconis gallopava TaxID=253628 RepID=A0A0D2ACL2_9PEZI|nr:uncharacterized protein PV09_04379 [Verruconis gallopava]KIW04633.1 hypothetical protein PV09_04379 [Verruconis gallopava]
MFGKEKAGAADDDNGFLSPPPRTPSSAPAPSGQPSPSSPSSPMNSVRQILRRPVAGRSHESLSRPSVRIRRNPSSSSIRSIESTSTTAMPAASAANTGLHDIPEEAPGRRRSSSEPQRPSWYSQSDAAERLARMSTVNEMPTISEGPGQPSSSAAGSRRNRGSSLRVPREMAGHLSPHVALHGSTEAADQLDGHLQPHMEGLDPPRNRVMRGLSNAVRRVPGVESLRSRMSQSDAASVDRRYDEDEYDSEMVDLLDVIDPEVATLSTLTNVQNSLFVPNLGRLVNRRPTYNFTRQQAAMGEFAESRLGTSETEPVDEEAEEVADGMTQGQTVDSNDSNMRPRLTHTSTISSTLSESRYAVLPHGETLAGWTPEEKAELNDLVRHMLHSRRAAFKRGLKGFGQYVKRPLGFFITLYATLITLFGAAWVLFLIGWISLGSRKDYIVNVVDNVLVALFAIMGDGLAPFRAVDTYHMAYIAYYHRLSWKIRRQKHLPKLQDRNDLPVKRNDNEEDLEYAAVETKEERREHRGAWEYSVLTPAQQKKLVHHQTIFARSHTFYKPHETETHHAFPLRLLITIVVLLDLHSCFQIALGACTWGIDYKTRPFWLTTFILCCSLTCNITGGILISVGDKRTRKKDVIEKMFRQQLTHTAMKEVRRRRLRANEEAAEASGPGSDFETLPVHVPPPVRKKKELERELTLQQQKVVDTDAAQQTRLAHEAEKKTPVKKNRWRSIPLLPYYITKESRDFRKEEKKQAKAEKAAAAAAAAAGHPTSSA